MENSSPVIHEIFKVPIYEVRLDLDIKKLQPFCNEYQQKDTGRIFSNVGGYQSKDLSLADEALQPLIKEINTHSSKFAKEFINNNEQVLSNMWININSYKDINKSHSHPGVDISGVYYVKTPDNCGKLVFENPAIDVFAYYQINLLSNEPKAYNEYNSPTWWKDAIENHLLLFPSWLKHYVDANLNKTEERISISFNTHQKGDFWNHKANKL